MSLDISKSVNFGSNRSGLATIGYRLLNYDGTVKLARTTSGIVELISGTGIYGAQISFDDTWSGFLIWDTGQATPLYAIEHFDYRNFTAGGYGIINDSVWSLKEKDQVLDRLKKILNIVKKFDNNKVMEAVKTLHQFNEKKLSEIINNLSEKAVIPGAEDLPLLKDYIEKLAEAIEVILEIKELDIITQEVESNVISHIGTEN